MFKTLTNVQSVRDEFKSLITAEQYVTDKTGVKMIEIVGASFIADEASIFGEPNYDYIKREIEWYESQSLDIDDIPEGPPTIWCTVASYKRKIHSNYGYLTMSMANHSQFDHCLNQLVNNKETRRALMIYTRPSIQTEYNVDGMSDFICTNAVQYVIRDGKLHAVVQMRSNDVVFGYKNDYAWQSYILEKLCHAYNLTTKSLPEDANHLKVGDIMWQVGSLHVYERHFKFVQ